MKDSNLVNGLNELLEKNYDAEKGYIESRESSNSAALKALFNQKASQRYDFGHELKSHIKNLGGEPQTGSSFTGTMHRAWIDFKSMMSNDTEESILEEVQRGEEAALDDYDHFIKEHQLPSDIMNTVNRQRNQIARSISKAENLEDVLNA